MLRGIKDEIESRNRGDEPDWQRERHFYEVAYAIFESIRNPWRNATMHVVSHYDENEAMDIFNITELLLRHLATELAE